MAPKNKFTREEMVAAGVELVREKGMEAVTARSIAEKLGVSTQPVFTCFSTMEEVRREIRAAAEKRYVDYAMEGLKEPVPFFGFGVRYIRFAREEPDLYRLLFLTTDASGKSGAMAEMERFRELVRPSLEEIYHIGKADADRYFLDMWLVVHSIATLTVTGGCPYSEKEIADILTGFSVSVYKAIKEIPGFAAGDFDRDKVFRELIAEDGK